MAEQIDDKSYVRPARMEENAEARAVERHTDLSFLLKDFEKIFDVYIYSHKERSEATRMFVTICTVPFILLSLFGIASNINFENKTMREIVDQFPNLIFFIFTVFGIAGIVPFHRFVAAHCNAYKMIRYMNNYRLFYYQLINEELSFHGWASAIEKDPRFPKPSASPYHWTSLFAYAMAGLNIFYVGFGLFLWEGKNSFIMMGLAAFFVGGAHYLLAKTELTSSDVALIEEKVKVDSLLEKI